MRLSDADAAPQHTHTLTVTQSGADLLARHGQAGWRGRVRQWKFTASRRSDETRLNVNPVETSTQFQDCESTDWEIYKAIGNTKKATARKHRAGTGERSTKRKEADVDGVINDYQAFGPQPLVPPVAPGTQPRRRHDRKGCVTDLASNLSDLVISSLS
jgi:hypothetical protein